MAQYRKKPVVIEAIQYGLAEYADSPFTFKNVSGNIEWLEKAVKDGVITAVFKSEDYWYLEIKTLEGIMTVSPDDWIIQGVNGEIYPCKPDIFTKTYDALPEKKTINIMGVHPNVG